MDNQKPGLFFRMFNEDDYLVINQWRNDPSQIQLMESPFRYVSLAIEQDWVRSKMRENVKEIYLAICLNDDSRLMIGYGSIVRIDYLRRCAEIGALWIGDKRYRSVTFTFEAMKEITRYAFFTYNIERLSASCLVEQTATYTFELAMGAYVEGRMRHSVLKDAQFHDEYLVALLRDDFLSLWEKGMFEIKSFNERVRRISALMKEGRSMDYIWHDLYDGILTTPS